MIKGCHMFYDNHSDDWKTEIHKKSDKSILEWYEKSDKIVNTTLIFNETHRWGMLEVVCERKETDGGV